MTPRRKWTARDDDLLRQFHAEGKDDKTIAYILDRGQSSTTKHRKALGLKSNGKRGCTKGGYSHTEEAKAKIRAAALKRWQEDETYRTNTLEKLHKGRRLKGRYKGWRIPTDPVERRIYSKLLRSLGKKAAHQAYGAPV